MPGVLLTPQPEQLQPGESGPNFISFPRGFLVDERSLKRRLEVTVARSLMSPLNRHINLRYQENGNAPPSIHLANTADLDTLNDMPLHFPGAACDLNRADKPENNDWYYTIDPHA